MFEKATFTIQRGERCGLVGRNGSGKSTLFRLLSGSEVPDSGCISMPTGYRMGILEQHIRFDCPTVLEETCLGLPQEEREVGHYKAEKLLSGLGFTEAMRSNSHHQLSGGYQLRIQLAKLLLSEPNCLLLDEPTNYLDILSVRFLTRLLQQWQGEMVLISHDLDFLDAVTTQMMAIHRRQIRKVAGKSAALFDLIAAEEAQHELTRQKVEKKRAHMQAFVDRFGAKATKASQAGARKKRIEKLPSLEKLKTLYNLNFTFNESPFPGKKMLSARSLSFSFEKQTSLIPNFCMEIHKAERIAIIGKNGQGKSTLLRLLAGELSPDKGEVERAPAVEIGYFGQTSIERLDPAQTVEEEITSANPDLSFSQVRGICGVMLFGGDLAKKPIGVLSGGEKSRVLLGKILAKRCNLLFLDEPTHHLDIESIEALIDAIESFAGTVVMVTHSEWVLRRIPFNKLIVCQRERQQIFDGDYDTFLEKERWEEEEKKEEEPKKSRERASPTKKSARAIGKCEERIAHLEKNLSQYNNQLAALFTSGESTESKELLARVERAEKELELLYAQLETLYQE